MAKIITKAVTRLQKFLAAIAGDAVAPTPITNQEKLLFNIAEEMKAASASDLPDIGSSDKNKYLHTNESTGALEWAGGGSGGDDTEYVTFTMDDALGEYVCDHSYEQIKETMRANKKVIGVVVAQEEGSVMKSFLPSFFDGSIDEGGGSAYFAIIFFGVGVSNDHGLPAMSTVAASVTMAGVVDVRINLL